MYFSNILIMGGAQFSCDYCVKSVRNKTCGCLFVESSRGKTTTKKKSKNCFEVINDKPQHKVFLISAQFLLLTLKVSKEHTSGFQVHPVFVQSMTNKGCGCDFSYT